MNSGELDLAQVRHMDWRVSRLSRSARSLLARSGGWTPGSVRIARHPSGGLGARTPCVRSPIGSYGHAMFDTRLPTQDSNIYVVNRSFLTADWYTHTES